MSNLHFFKLFFLSNSSVLQSYLWSYLTYRSMLNLKSMLKTFYLNLILSVFWLTSIIYEVGSNEVASFFWPKLHECKKSYTANKNSQSTAFVQPNGCNWILITAIDCAQPMAPTITVWKIAYRFFAVIFCLNCSCLVLQSEHL